MLMWLRSWMNQSKNIYIYIKWIYICIYILYSVYEETQLENLYTCKFYLCHAQSQGQWIVTIILAGILHGLIYSIKQTWKKELVTEIKFLRWNYNTYFYIKHLYMICKLSKKTQLGMVDVVMGMRLSSANMSKEACSLAITPANLPVDEDEVVYWSTVLGFYDMICCMVII